MTAAAAKAKAAEAAAKADEGAHKKRERDTDAEEDINVVSPEQKSGKAKDDAMDEEQRNEGIETQNGSSVPPNQGERHAHASAPKVRNAFQVMMNQRNAKAKMNAKDSQAMDTEVDTNNEKVGDDDIIMEE